MRIILISAMFAAFFPATSWAQSWEDWHNTHPTYQPSTSQSLPSLALSGAQMTQKETDFAKDLMENCLTESSRRYCDCAVNELLTSQALKPVDDDLDLPLEESEVPPSVAVPIKACVNS